MIKKKQEKFVYETAPKVEQDVEQPTKKQTGKQKRDRQRARNDCLHE